MTAATKTAGSIPKTMMAAWYNAFSDKTKSPDTNGKVRCLPSRKWGTATNLYTNTGFRHRSHVRAYNANARPQITAIESISLVTPITCPEAISAIDGRADVWWTAIDPINERPDPQGVGNGCGSG